MLTDIAFLVHGLRAGAVREAVFVPGVGFAD